MTNKRKATRGSAINAFCKMCIYDKGAEGTWRQQVEACTAKTCPLFQFRPLPAPAKPKDIV